MSRVILWQAPDGSLKLTYPVEPPLPGEGERLYLDRLALAAQVTDPGLADCAHLGTVPVATLPASRRFRACWRFGADTVDIDLPAARLHVLVELREERSRRLLASDADRARLEEVGTLEQRQALTAYRQQLRDLPAVAAVALANLTTAAELEAYQSEWPLLPRADLS